MVRARSCRRGAALERAIVRVRGAVASRVSRSRGQFVRRRHADPRRFSAQRPALARMKVVNPATGSVIADLPEDSPAAVRKKYARARAVQPGWAATPIRKRISAIAAFRE